MDDDIPGLQDFSEQLQKNKEPSIDIGNYTKPIQDQSIHIQQPKQQNNNFTGKDFLMIKKTIKTLLSLKKKKKSFRN
ncbi:unnamed protein product [Paramecium sonneborni]|uniref:Uncharacterized protein n=1 Tax=Paramecium sonneborni TaxID=65129 RepID=A0A8S1N6H3_9CILI|nr:unnamed protein product [Paramecium sonneborni]